MTPIVGANDYALYAGNIAAMASSGTGDSQRGLGYLADQFAFCHRTHDIKRFWASLVITNETSAVLVETTYGSRPWASVAMTA